jgi:hypothetical protein
MMNLRGKILGWWAKSNLVLSPQLQGMMVRKVQTSTFKGARA